MRIPLAIVGLSGVIGPLTLMRELMAASGGDERGAVAVLTASWLWLALGAWLAECRGRSLKLKRETLATWSRPYVGTLVLAVLFLPLQVVLPRAVPQDWLGEWGSVLLGLLLSAPLSLLLGAQYALGRRLLEVDEGVLGRAFVYQSVGAAVGGLLFASVLAPWFDAMQIVLLAAALNLAAGWWLSISLGQGLAEGLAGPVLTYALMVIAIALGTLALPLGAALEGTTLARQWPGLGAVGDSSRGRVIIVDTRCGSRIYWAGVPLSGVPDESSEMPVRQALAAHPHPRRLMLIGGGPEALESALAGSLEVTYYAEPDDELVMLWQERLPAVVGDTLSDRRVILAAADARTYLAEVPRGFDLIVVNLPGPLSQLLNRYYTVEFWQLVREALEPGGMLVARLPDMEDDRNATCLAGVRAAFMHQFPSMKEMGDDAGGRQFLLVGLLDRDPEAHMSPDRGVNLDLAPTCPPGVAWGTRPPAEDLLGWAANYGWLAGPIGLLLLVGLVRQDLRVPLLPAFAALGSGATLAAAMIGVQRVSGLLYTAIAELILASAVGTVVSGGTVSLLARALKGRARLALAATSLLAQGLIALLGPGFISRMAGDALFPWATVGLVGAAGLPVGVTLAIASSQGRPGAALVAAPAGGAIGVGLFGLLIIPSAGMTVAGQAAAVLTCLGLVCLWRA